MKMPGPSPEPKEKTIPENDFVKTTGSPGQTFQAYGEGPAVKITPAKITPAVSQEQPTSVALPKVAYPAYGQQTPELPLLTETKR
jgi:hypothetical protein